MANVRVHSRSSHSHSLPLPISSTDRSEADRVYQFESESDSDDCAFELADVANQAESSEDANIPYIPFQLVSSNDSPTPHHTQIGGRSRDGSACNSLQFIDTEKIVKVFHAFMLTKGGGGKRNTPIKKDNVMFQKALVSSMPLLRILVDMMFRELKCPGVRRLFEPRRLF